MVLASVLVLALASAGLGVYVFEQASCYLAFSVSRDRYIPGRRYMYQD